MACRVMMMTAWPRQYRIPDSRQILEISYYPKRCQTKLWLHLVLSCLIVLSLYHLFLVFGHSVSILSLSWFVLSILVLLLSLIALSCPWLILSLSCLYLDLSYPFPFLSYLYFISLFIKPHSCFGSSGLYLDSYCPFLPHCLSLYIALSLS